MNTWSKEINLDDYAECKEFRIHYYTRRMNGGYNSHLFLVNWDSEEQLLKGWNQIDSFVAVNIQSQTELLIERSNFYIIHFVKKTVMKEIKREIEYNPFCAKKYVYDNFQEDLYVERNYVEEKIFHLAVSEVTEYENKKMRVKKIKLKNFRGYKGCVEFNLVDQDSVFWRKTKEYIITAEMSKLWGISSRRISLLCNQGRVLGAEKRKNIAIA